MNFKEFVQKNKKSIHEFFECKNIDEFKKIVDKNHINYNGEEDLKHAWGYVQSQAAGKESSLGDDDLASVAGGDASSTGSTGGTGSVVGDVAKEIAKNGLVNVNTNRSHLTQTSDHNIDVIIESDDEMSADVNM